jgi:hypothetical protein
MNPGEHRVAGGSRSGPGDHGGEGGAGPELNFTGSTYAGGWGSHVGRGTFPDGTEPTDPHGPGATESQQPAAPRGARGPKGYTRADERILEDLVERLDADPAVDVSEVTVQVQGGRVVLAGTVPHRAIKHRIEDVVDGCPGVGEIDNRIRVRGRYGETGV